MPGVCEGGSLFIKWKDPSDWILGGEVSECHSAGHAAAINCRSSSRVFAFCIRAATHLSSSTILPYPDEFLPSVLPSREGVVTFRTALCRINAHIKMDEGDGMQN